MPKDRQGKECIQEQLASEVEAQSNVIKQQAAKIVEEMSQMSKMDSEIFSLQQELGKYRIGGKKPMPSKESEAENTLKAEIKVLEAENRKLQDEVAAFLNDEYYESEKENITQIDLPEEQLKKSTLNQSVDSRIEELQESNQLAEIQLEDLNSQLLSLQEENERYIEEITELNQQINELKGGQKESAIPDVDEQQYIRHIQILQEEIEQKDQELKRQNQKISTFESEESATIKELQLEIQQLYNELESEKEEYKEELVEVKSSNAELEKNQIIKQEEIKILQDQLNNVVSDNQKLSRSIQELDLGQQNEVVAEKLDDISQKLDLYHQDVQSLAESVNNSFNIEASQKLEESVKENLDALDKKDLVISKQILERSNDKNLEYQSALEQANQSILSLFDEVQQLKTEKAYLKIDQVQKEAELKTSQAYSKCLESRLKASSVIGDTK